MRYVVSNALQRIPDHDDKEGITNGTNYTVSYDVVPVSVRERFVDNGTGAARNEWMQLKGALVVGYTLCALCMLASFLEGIWTYIHRNTHVVRASQPFFLIMTSVGTLIMASSIIPTSLQDSNTSQQGLDMACMAVWCLYSMGFVVAFSALLSKVWRLNEILPFVLVPLSLWFGFS